MDKQLTHLSKKNVTAYRCYYRCYYTYVAPNKSEYSALPHYTRVNSSRVAICEQPKLQIYKSGIVQTLDFKTTSKLNPQIAQKFALQSTHVKFRCDEHGFHYERVSLLTLAPVDEVLQLVLPHMLGKTFKLNYTDIYRHIRDIFALNKPTTHFTTVRVFECVQ